MFLFAALLACGCGGSSAPTSPPATAPPVSVAANFTGSWEVTFTLLECRSPRPWHCPDAGTSQPMTIRLEEAGSAVSGLVLTKNILVPISGTISADGLTATGSRPISPGTDGRYEIQNMKIRAASSTQLAGTLELHTLDIAVPTIFVGSISATYSRQPLGSPLDFAGEWAGVYTVRSCTNMATNTPGNACHPAGVNRSESFRLTLTPSGGSVTGKLQVGPDGTFDVRATVSGGELRIDASDATPEGSVLGMALLTLRARRDSLGRLTGTFAYSTELGSRSLSDAELTYVALIR